MIGSIDGDWAARQAMVKVAQHKVNKPEMCPLLPRSGMIALRGAGDGLFEIKTKQNLWFGFGGSLMHGVV
jgi:hypothetical protein